MRTTDIRASGPMALTVAVVLATTLAGCASTTRTTARTTLTVFAAASLRTTFQQLGTTLERGHQQVSVRFNFAGSSDLASAIQQGAPADVFASADLAIMATLVHDELVNSPQPFASNTLQIAVPPDNPARITSLADLGKPGVNLVICSPKVPCGAAAGRVAAAAGVSLTPVSEEQNVTDVLNKVITGEADAGLVYVTDVKAAAGRVRGIAFPQSGTAANVYPIATVVTSRQSALASTFVRLVTGRTGETVLGHAGFAKP